MEFLLFIIKDVFINLALKQNVPYLVRPEGIRVNNLTMYPCTSLPDIFNALLKIVIVFSLLLVPCKQDYPFTVLPQLLGLVPTIKARKICLQPVLPTVITINILSLMALNRGAQLIS
jgi:hypothetical protein